MTINDQIKDEKLQYDINREAAKISVLSSGKIQKLSVEDAVPNSAFATDEAKEELNKIEEIEENVNIEKVFFKSNKKHIVLKIFQQ